MTESMKVLVANVGGKQTVCTDNGDGTGMTICALDYVPKMADRITQLESALMRSQEEYAHLLNDIHSMMALGWRCNFSQKGDGDIVKYVRVLLETIERERMAKEALESERGELVAFVAALSLSSRRTQEVSGTYGGIEEINYISDIWKDNAIELLSKLKGE